MTDTVLIYSTVAVDALEDEDCLYEGFYPSNDSLMDTALKSANPNDEKSRRLLESIRELEKVMKNTSVETMDKVLNAAMEEEVRQRKAMVQHLVEQSEKYWTGKRRQIELAVVFLNISEIEGFVETFAAEVLISARWREPALDGLPESDLKEVDFENYFNPDLFVENLLVERRATITNNVFRNENGETYMLEKTWIRGVFSYSAQFTTYPFDVQDLHINLTTDNSVDKIELIPHEEEISALRRRVNVDQLSQTWHLYSHTDMQLRTLKSDLTGSAVDRPALDIMVQIGRKPHYFWYNTYAIVFFVTLLTVFTFVMDPSDNLIYAARLQLCSMIFLTLTNFKISTSLMIPKLPYLNCLDKYTLYNILSLTIVTTYNSILVEFFFGQISLTALRNIDRFSMISIFAIYFFWNILYFIWLRYSVCKKRRLAKKREKEWKKWADKKNKWSSARKTKGWA